MQILFHRYGSICEPDIMDAFRTFEIEVIEDDIEINIKNISAGDRIAHLSEMILQRRPDFVFSVNFFPYISDLCEKLQMPYVCWIVDCPVLELFSVSIRNRYNRIFIFDYAQYEKFSPQNPDCIHYLPLAVNTGRLDALLSTITEEDIASYSSDVSFVGSLYTEKSPLSSLTLPEFTAGYTDGLVESQLRVNGYNLFEDALSDECIEVLKPHFPDAYVLPGSYSYTDRYTAAHYYLSMRASELERIRTLNLLASRHRVTLYTRSDTSPLVDVTCRNGASTLTEMPKIFALSKINLNITMRSIQTGLSLRIWDILGCGGFLLSNYQAEIPEYFEMGTDLVCYENARELQELTDYYLTHEEQRLSIAYSGYTKVKQAHTYVHRIAQMLKSILS